MDENPLEGLSSLVHLSGVSVPARARFIGEALVSSTLTSVTLGLSFGMFGAMTPVGPLLPFLFGSWTGYTIGLMGHWRTCRQATFHYAKYYPSLLAHALASERFIFVPQEVVQASEERLLQHESSMSNSQLQISSGNSTVTLEDWIRDGGVGRLTWSLLAAQSCRADIEDLQKQQRQKLMNGHTERHG